MKRYFWILAAALVSVAACNKNELQNGAEEEPGTPAVTVIRAEINNGDSKGSVNDAAKFTWNTGDRIAVWAEGYKISDPLDASFDGKSSADFTFSGANAVTESKRANFAIYPASLVWDGTDIISSSASNYTESSLKLTMPQMYSLSEVQGDLSPTPMIAANAENGSLSFKALCPLIRFTVRNIPKQANRLEFTFDNYDVFGEFELKSVNPGTSGITKATDGQAEYFLQTKSIMANETIIVNRPGSAWQDELVINISVPVVGDPGYEKFVITARDNDKAILSQTVWPNGTSGWKPERTASKKLTVNLPVFSLSDSKKGVFAPGNLQAKTTDGTTWTWGFANHQYDICFKDNEKINGDGTASGACTVDLFGWVGSSSTFTAGTAASYGISKSKDNFGSGSESLKNDWGTIVSGSWRSLSSAEWEWVLGPNAPNPGTNCRTSSTVGGVENARYALARVRDDGISLNIKGLIVFPDAFSLPAGVSLSNINTSGGLSYNTLAPGDWDKLESAGCIFLPFGGDRDVDTDGNASLGSASKPTDFNQSSYWTSSHDTGPTNARSILLQNSGVSVGNAQKRYIGESVRLALDLN